MPPGAWGSRADSLPGGRQNARAEWHDFCHHLGSLRGHTWPPGCSCRACWRRPGLSWWGGLGGQGRLTGPSFHLAACGAQEQGTPRLHGFLHFPLELAQRPAALPQVHHIADFQSVSNCSGGSRRCAGHGWVPLCGCELPRQLSKAAEC